MSTKFPISDELWSRGKELIPAGTQTLSKGPDQFVQGVTPKYLLRGKGSHVWCVDGNEYIDYPMALGPILLGYDYPAVTEAVIAQVRSGTTFTLMHPLEVEVAELITELVPSAEQVRYGKNGADVTSAAIKVARAYTGRDSVAYCGYHGCQDWYAVTTPRNKGIPKVFASYMHPFEYNRLESLEQIFAEEPGKIAAVIMEVPGVNPAINPDTGMNFLQEVKELAHANGAVFIMDEIVTGFRYSTGGAQKLFDVTPDMTCLGKGMGNGFAISALAGSREVMRELDEVFFSMTYSGDTIGLAATKATLTELMERPVIEYLWKTGERLHAGIGLAAENAGVDLRVSGNGPRGGISVFNKDGKEDLLLKSIFMAETIKRGILFGGPVFISYSHTEEDIARTIAASAEAMEVLAKAIASGEPESFLEGEPVGVVFRKRE